MQDCISCNKIKENKYKILRMSLMLGSDDNRSETLNNFEESAREIDAMNDETYLKDLEDKFYDTLKLEEEEKKLAVLVDYIGGRVEQRIALLSDFANITGYDLSNLPPIKYYDKLDDYKERLKYIREYLGNTEQINILTDEITEAEIKLKEAYLNKATSEECNNRNEEILLNKFKNIIKTIPELKEISENNIELKLTEITNNVKESKKSLDIFTKSFATLSSSGISYDEEQEYKSYVENAKEVYYKNKEQEFLLVIYQWLLKKESEYNNILEKRQKINNLLYERIELRKELNINDVDKLSILYDLLDKQYNEIEIQKENIINIELLNEKIENKKVQLNELEQENQKVEILSLLREFCLIETYTDEEVDIIPEVEKEKEEIVEEEEIDNPVIEISMPEIPEISISTPELDEQPIVSENIFMTPVVEPVIEPVAEKVAEEIKEEPKENEVVSIENATKIDLDLIHSKANKVMQRVGEMLGIKTEETEIVSITNESPIEETIEKSIDEPPISQKELPKVEVKAEELPKNPFPEENPLFSNNIEEKIPSSSIEENSFWFPSDTPDALNELPDLDIQSNDNNIMPDLNFPDLKIDFGNNDNNMEEE